MVQRQQEIKLPFSPKAMFDLVADVECYPEFVPYCTGLRILKRSQHNDTDILLAQMIVQYKVFREQFKCKVILDPTRLTIDVDFVEGPIKKLENKWRFHDLDDAGSKTDFFIDFEFNNFLLQNASNRAFDKVYTYLTNAFVERAHHLHGSNSTEALT